MWKNRKVVIAVLVVAFSILGLIGETVTTPSVHASGKTAGHPQSLPSLGCLNLSLLNYCYLKNVHSTGSHNVYLASTDGNNLDGRSPLLVTAQISQAVSNKVSTSIKISLGKVSAAVGYDVTTTSTATSSSTISIPAHQWWTINGYAVYNDTAFEIWQHTAGFPPDQLVGVGTSSVYTTRVIFETVRVCGCWT